MSTVLLLRAPAIHRIGFNLHAAKDQSGRMMVQAAVVDGVLRGSCSVRVRASVVLDVGICSPSIGSRRFRVTEAI